MNSLFSSLSSIDDFRLFMIVLDMYDIFSYTVYINYIYKLASPDFAGNFEGEPYNKCAIHDIGSCELKSKHPKANCLP